MSGFDVVNFDFVFQLASSTTSHSDVGFYESSSVEVSGLAELKRRESDYNSEENL